MYLMISDSFELKNKQDMNNVYSQIHNDGIYDCLSFDIENVYLKKKFYDKLASLTVKKFSISYRFTGDCLSNCASLPKGIESLSINSPLNLSECVINAICQLTDLKELYLYGYISISMQDIDKVLLHCRCIHTMYLSYPDLDIIKPTHPHVSVEQFRSVGFDIDSDKTRTVDIYEWFPNLKLLDLYCGNKFNVDNSHLLKDLRELNLKFHEYDEKHASEIDLIYPQLIDANIMIDPVNTGRCATARQGCHRWPLKNRSN
jgi:hypothetical protein